MPFSIVSEPQEFIFLNFCRYILSDDVVSFRRFEGTVTETSAGESYTSVASQAKRNNSINEGMLHLEGLIRTRFRPEEYPLPDFASLVSRKGSSKLAKSFQAELKSLFASSSESSLSGSTIFVLPGMLWREEYPDLKNSFFTGSFALLSDQRERTISPTQPTAINLLALAAGRLFIVFRIKKRGSSTPQEKFFSLGDYLKGEPAIINLSYDQVNAGISELIEYYDAQVVASQFQAGVELMSNHSFNADLAGWSQSQDFSAFDQVWTWQNGFAKMEGDETEGGGARASQLFQNINLEAGKSYNVEIDFVAQDFACDLQIKVDDVVVSTQSYLSGQQATMTYEIAASSTKSYKIGLWIPNIPESSGNSYLASFSLKENIDVSETPTFDDQQDYFRIRVDHQRPNQERWFLYRNRFGGWDSLRLTGEAKEDTKKEQGVASRILEEDYALGDLKGSVISTDYKEEIEVNTGYFASYAKMKAALKGFFLSDLIYIYGSSGTWRPVRIITDSLGTANDDRVDLAAETFKLEYLDR